MVKSISLLQILCAAALCITILPADAQESWKLLNEDSRGNFLYIDEGSAVTGEEDGMVKVTFRFELNQSGTTMYFVDEFDCNRSLVRRVSLRMLEPVCTGDGETYSTMLKGGWDTISEGIERTVKNAICKAPEGSALTPE